MTFKIKNNRKGTPITFSQLKDGTFYIEPGMNDLLQVKIENGTEGLNCIAFYENGSIYLEYTGGDDEVIPVEVELVVKN